MNHHAQKASWGGKGLFGLHFHIIVHHQRNSGQELKQSRNLETGVGPVAMEEVLLTVLLLVGLLSLPFYRT